jgi:hypothetical protein
MGVNDITLEKVHQEGRFYNKKQAVMAGVLRNDTKIKSMLAIF